MEDKKLYMAVFQGAEDQPEQILGVELTIEKAWQIVTSVMSQNPGANVNQFRVKEFAYQRDLKMLDYQEQK